jgi:hypothetical protein
MAYVCIDRALGSLDLSQVVTAGLVGVPWNGTSNVLPSVTVEQQLGQIVTAYDTSANADTAGAGGFGEFIFLAVPTSTAITIGLLYSWTPSDYKVVIVSGTVSISSGFPIACAVNAVTSNSTSVQYTWFQVGGRCKVLKTAVAVSPNVSLYASATAGRVKVLASAFRAIIGARSANAASVTSTTSTVAMYLNGRPCITAGT